MGLRGSGRFSQPEPEGVCRGRSGKKTATLCFPNQFRGPALPILLLTLFFSMKWLTTTAPMLQLHLGGSVTLHGGRIIVSGGYDETFGLSGVIEAYNAEENSWKVIGKMRRPMFWHGCVSVYRQVL